MDQQAGNKDQSVNCECGDMSGVSGPLADRADASDEAYRRRRAIPAPRDRCRGSPRRLHWCTNARKTSPKLPFPPLSGKFGAASGRDGLLGKALQDHEIGHDRCSARPSQNRVRMGAPKLPHRIPLVVHYLRKAGCHHLPIAHWSIPPLLDRIPNKREFLARSLGAWGFSGCWRESRQGGGRRSWF